jgi:hypothetical protein
LPQLKTALTSSSLQLQILQPQTPNRPTPNQIATRTRPFSAICPNPRRPSGNPRQCSNLPQPHQPGDSRARPPISG